jgi:hypothetical protein
MQGQSALGSNINILILHDIVASSHQEAAATSVSVVRRLYMQTWDATTGTAGSLMPETLLAYRRQASFVTRHGDCSSHICDPFARWHF